MAQREIKLGTFGTTWTQYELLCLLSVTTLFSQVFESANFSNLNSLFHQLGFRHPTVLQSQLQNDNVRVRNTYIQRFTQSQRLLETITRYIVSNRSNRHLNVFNLA